MRRPIRWEHDWTIGVCEGTSPFALACPGGVKNPVLTTSDVTDATAHFVADPLMVRDGDTWYMFFEVKDARARRGKIGLATSLDGRHWRYERIVLDEPFHLAYPFVVWTGGEYYMIPDNLSGSTRLYRARDFPWTWENAGVLLAGYCADPTVFEHDGRWWMFGQTYSSQSGPALRLFHAAGVPGPWREHPKSPLFTGDSSACRPAGRVFSHNGGLVRFAQVGVPYYGSSVRAHRIVELSTTAYREQVLEEGIVPKASWNRKGTHTLDAHQVAPEQWLACGDGFRRWRLRLGAEFTERELAVMREP
jgi:hypothetical protein